MTSQLADMILSLDFFDVAVFLLLNLVTGRSFMSISLLVLHITNASNKMLLNAAKRQGYSRFNRFWVIKGKPTEGGKINTPLLPQITVKVVEQGV